jgi:hypothetical protein
MHRSLDKGAPFPRPVQQIGRITSRALLGGLQSRAHPLIDRRRARKTWRADAGERGPGAAQHSWFEMLKRAANIELICVLSLSETYALKYWWCTPPRTRWLAGSLVMLQELKKHHGYAREYLRQAEHEGAAGKVPGSSSNTIRNCRRNSFSRS